MIGKNNSHYRIIEKLDAGGMGEVFLAEDIHLNRRVAIKVLPDAFARDPEVWRASTGRQSSWLHSVTRTLPPFMDSKRRTET